MSYSLVPYILGHWLDIQNTLAKHRNSQPIDSDLVSYAIWKKKLDEIQQDIDRWSQDFGSRKILSVRDFSGWCRDLVDIFQRAQNQRIAPPEVALGSFADAVQWACRTADSLKIPNRPMLPNRLSLSYVIRFFDAMIVASIARQHYLDDSQAKLHERMRSHRPNFPDLIPRGISSVPVEENDTGFMPAKWFEKNYEISGDSLRQHKSKGRIKTRKDGAKLLYSIADAAQLWPDKFKSNPPQRERS